MCHFSATSFLALALALGNSTPAQATLIDDQAIRQVIETFRTAIITKDKARFAPLFLFEKITWQAVLDEASLARIKAKRPATVKADVIPDETWITFIDAIVKDPKPSEETFSNITIDSDGSAATVAFDYVYLYDGKQTNHGREHWQLVNTESGWKISAVTYSLILPPPAN
jgi:hypothetical protein